MTNQKSNKCVKSSLNKFIFIKSPFHSLLESFLYKNQCILLARFDLKHMLNVLRNKVHNTGIVLNKKNYLMTLNSLIPANPKYSDITFYDNNKSKLLHISGCTPLEPALVTWYVLTSFLNSSINLEMFNVTVSIKVW